MNDALIEILRQRDYHYNPLFNRCRKDVGPYVFSVATSPSSRGAYGLHVYRDGSMVYNYLGVIDGATQTISDDVKMAEDAALRALYGAVTKVSSAGVEVTTPGR